MSWQTDMTLITRSLINDLDTPTTYSDARIQQLILVAAQLVKTEIVDFNTSYTVNFASSGISPDPTDSSTRDEGFINLVCLKSACLFDRGSARSNMLNAGIRIVHDGDTIERGSATTSAAQALLSHGYCAAYDAAKFEYQRGNNLAGEIIMGPYKLLVYQPTNQYRG